MAKLFAFSMEESSQQVSEDDELLIDKVIRKDKIDPDSPLVSEELKKQRTELKIQIEKSISQSAQDTNEDEDSEEDVGDQETSDEEAEVQDTEDETQDDDSQVAEDEKPETDEEDKKDSEESLESFFSNRKTKRLSMSHVNTGINSFMKHYESEIQGVKRKGFSFEELPIVHVKSEMIEFLTRVSKVLDKSISEISESTIAHEKGFLLLNEKLTVLKADIEAGKKTYTESTDITPEMLVSMAVKTSGRIDASESTEIVLDANKVFASVFQMSMGKDLNTFYQILLNNSFATSGSKNEYTYKTLLPGLTELRFSLFPFKSYLSDDLDETEFFVVKNVSQTNKEGIYESDIKQPEAAVHLLDMALETVASATVTLDHLRKVVAAMNAELSNVKVTIQDIQSGTISKIKAEEVNTLVKTVMLYRLLASYARGLDNTNILYSTSSLSYVSARYVS